MDPNALSKEVQSNKVFLGDRVFQEENNLIDEYLNERVISKNSTLNMSKDESFEQKWKKLFGVTQ
jgi:hypothetical protein